MYKRQLLFAWAAVYGVIQGVMGYMFLIPYFSIVALVAELCMVGKNTYQSAVRNRIGWMVNSIGNFVGCAVPVSYTHLDVYKRQEEYTIQQPPDARSG